MPSMNSPQHERAWRVDQAVSAFQCWLSKRKNQRRFVTLQEAFEAWLDDSAFDWLGEDDFLLAVQVILVFLSRCIANPTMREIPVVLRSHGAVSESQITLQVAATFGSEEGLTFWEFFTEEKIHAAYRSYAKRAGTWQAQEGE